MNAVAARPGVARERPLVCHVVFRFDYGGLENGVVNLINGLPRDEFRHAVVALTAASDFRRRIARDDVAVHELHKQSGQDPRAYWRMHRLFREIRPVIVHTRNVGTMDCAAIAAAAGVPVRVHGEHGWDVHDLDGESRKYRAVRRIFGRFVHRFVAVSEELQAWLVDRVGFPPGRVVRICNGVDTARFRPAPEMRARLPAEIFPPGAVVFGSVTRFSAIKDPLNLVRAFADAEPRLRASGVEARLLMAGDGELRAPALELLAARGCAGRAWLPGSRDDVPQLLAASDVFVLGSLREGISNTVLEAMSTGLPIVASRTGGNLELVEHEVNGMLVEPGAPAALGAALVAYGEDAARRARHGAASRRRVEERYSLERMLGDYRDLYARLSARVGVQG